MVFSTGFANGHCKYTYTSAMSSGLARKMHGADGASITFSLLFRRRRLGTRYEVGKYCGDSLLGYGDDEVRVSDLWEEGEGELASENYMDEGMCKARLPDHLISKNATKIKNGKM